METYYETLLKLRESIVTNDIIILMAAIVTSALMVITLVIARTIKEKNKRNRRDENRHLSIFLYHSIRRVYTLFLTMISIFPLLGMLGTVVGLLGLDLTNGDMENLKNNFFIALTSTAWGIIFSVIFKVMNAWISDNVEEQIEASKKIVEKYKTL